MTLKKWGTWNWKGKNQVACSAELAMEVAMDLSQDRLHNETVDFCIWYLSPVLMLLTWATISFYMCVCVCVCVCACACVRVEQMCNLRLFAGQLLVCIRHLLDTIFWSNFRFRIVYYPPPQNKGTISFSSPLLVPFQFQISVRLPHDSFLSLLVQPWSRTYVIFSKRNAKDPLQVHMFSNKFCNFTLAVQKLSKNLELTHNSRHQRGEVKQVLYWRISNIRHRSTNIYLSGLSGDQVLCTTALHHFFVLLYMYTLYLHCSVMDPKYRVVLSSL